MAYPPLASVSDLGARLGTTLTGDDATRAGAVLDDVSAIARKEAATTWVQDDGVTLSDSLPSDVVAVVLTAARRLYVNPDGYASEQDGDYSYRLPAESLNGGVFTSAEIEMLRTYRGTSGLWSLQVEGANESSRYTAGILERIWDATL